MGIPFDGKPLPLSCTLRKRVWSLTLPSSLILAVSAFRGKNRKTGNLAAFLRKIERGEVLKGSILLLESLDRLSREELEESFDLLRSIVRAGVEVHTISDRQVTRRGIWMPSR